METRGGKRWRFKIRQYGVPSKYRDCPHMNLSGRSIRMLSPGEIAEFKRVVALRIDRAHGIDTTTPKTRRSIV